MKPIILLIMMFVLMPSVMALELVQQPSDMTIPSDRNIKIQITDYVIESDGYYNKLFFTYNGTDYELNRTHQQQNLFGSISLDFYGIDAYIGGGGEEYNITDVYFYASDGTSNITTDMFDIYFRYVAPIKAFNFPDFNLTVGEFDSFEYSEVYTYYDGGYIQFDVDNVTYTVNETNTIVETDVITIEQVGDVVFMASNGGGTVNNVLVCTYNVYGTTCTDPFTLTMISPSEDFQEDITLPFVIIFVVMLILAVVMSLGLFGDDMTGFGGFMIIVEGLILLFSSFSAILSMFLIGIGIMFIVRK